MWDVDMEEDAKNIMDGEKDQWKCTHGDWNRRRWNATTNSTKKKLGFFGHVMRSDGLEKRMMLAYGDGRRRRGWERRKWMDEIHEVIGMKLMEPRDVTTERKHWRRLVKTVTRAQRVDSTRLYDKNCALHKTFWGRPRMALNGPPTYCGVGHFWPAWYFQMRRPDLYVPSMQ